MLDIIAPDKISFDALLAQINQHSIGQRLLTQAIEAVTPGNSEIHQRLHKHTHDNHLLSENPQKTMEEAQKPAIFETPLGKVVIEHINVKEGLLQERTQNQFALGNRIELTLATDVTIREDCSADGVTVEVHVNHYRAGTDDFAELPGLALRDAISLTPLVDEQLGAMAISQVGESNAHITLTITNGETRTCGISLLPLPATTPMTTAIFAQMCTFEQKQFAAAITSEGLFEARLGHSLIRKQGAPAALEIHHIDIASLTQLREYNGKDYSIVLAQTLPSHLIVQLIGMPVSEIAEMDPWLMDIFGKKTIKQILNNSGQSTIMLNKSEKMD